MSRTLETTQRTLTRENRTSEIVITLPRGGTPSMFIRREEVLLNGDEIIRHREIESIAVEPGDLTAGQRTTLAGIIAAIDERADQREALGD